MKKLLNLFLIFFIAVVLLGVSGCFSNDDSKDTVVDTPTDFPATDSTYDSTYKGVYKGVFTGSSGNFRLSVYNDNAGEATLYLTFDNVDVTITGTETVEGNNYKYTFTKDGYDFVITIEASGNIISVTFTAPDHTGTINVTAEKETSTTTVYCYEGTATGSMTAVYGSTKIPLTVTSVWNFTITGNTYRGYSKHSAVNTAYNIDYSSEGGCEGTIALDDAITFSSLPEHFSASGSKNGSAVSGTWDIEEFTRTVNYMGQNITLTISGSGTWTGSAKYQ